MSGALRRHADVIKLLAQARHSSVCRAILAKADRGLVQAISEICLNTLHGNIPLKKPHKKRLAKFKKVLRSLSKKKGLAWKKKKKLILRQKGGFWPLLLAPAIGLISSLINR